MSKKHPKRFKSLIRIGLALPFLLGVSWTLCHPIISIVTGELKCREMFIDEHALDPQSYNTVPYKSTMDGARTILDTKQFTRWDMLTFDLYQILPFHSVPVTKPTEAIVIIISSHSNLHIFQILLQQLIRRLTQSSWLAKAILIVVPKQYETNLTRTVETFLHAYLHADHTLPPSVSMYIIRQLLVLDLYNPPSQENSIHYHYHQQHHAPPTHVQVLSQGPHGLLPNLDMVFVTIQTLLRYLPTQLKIVTHPYDMTWWEQVVSQQFIYWNIQSLSSWWHIWAKELGHLGAFVATMMRGTYGPHSYALQQGIDSITIRLKHSPGQKSHLGSEPMLQIFQSIEHIIRALSNLHERLHHSVTFYLLPSPTKFISYGEYIYPTILIVLPFVIRAIALLFLQIRLFPYRLVTTATSIITLLVSLFYLSTQILQGSFLHVDKQTIVLTLVYITLIFTWHKITQSSVVACGTKWKDLQQSIQFTACLLAIYMHVPLVLSHVSLAYPSAFSWCILLALPYYAGSLKESWMVVRVFYRTLVIGIMFITWPCIIIVHVFRGYTAYVCFIYMPLHLFLTLLFYQRYVRNYS